MERVAFFIDKTTFHTTRPYFQSSFNGRIELTLEAPKRVERVETKFVIIIDAKLLMFWTLLFWGQPDIKQVLLI